MTAMADEPADHSFWELHRRLRDDLWSRHRRVLPFGDELFDRWERARFLGFGEGASIYDTTAVYGDVSVGPRTWIGPFVVLEGTAGLSIGANCSISAGVQIYTHDSVAWAVSGGAASYRAAPTRIGDCCYIGPLCVIAAGVTIGSRCIVGAHSFVSRDVPDNSFVAGCPAVLKGTVRIAEDHGVVIDPVEGGRPCF